MKQSYFYLILAMTALDMILLLVSLRHQGKKAVRSFIKLLLLLIVAHSFYGASLLIPPSGLKYWIHELKFIGVAFFSRNFYIMYMELFDRHDMLTRARKALLCVVPGITVLLAATNEWHHLFRVSLFAVERDSGSFIGVASGPLFWLYILYSYALYVFVIAFVIRIYLKTPRLYRMRLAIMIFAALATMVINFISISNLLFTDYGDATLISFSIASLLQCYGLVLFKPVRMIRAARDMAVNEIKDPLIIFDYKNEFLDANTAALALFDFSEAETLSDFIKRAALPESDFEEPFRRGDTWFIMQHKAVFDEDGILAASAILLSDITQMKLREQELQHLATHDYLTGIPNRLAFHKELLRIGDKDLPVTLARFNIRGMKLVNNNYGNEAGDKIIRRVATELSRLKDGAFCARIKGDEFALILRNTTDTEASERIHALTEQLQGIELVHGLASKQTSMDNINIINKISMDNMYINKLMAHTGTLRGRE